MSDAIGYERCVTYQFEANGETWALGTLELHRDGSLSCEVEETRKNGQEDTHMGGPLIFEDGQWEWGDNGNGGSLIVEYASQETADAILAHVNQYGHPEERLPR